MSKSRASGIRCGSAVMERYSRPDQLNAPTPNGTPSASGNSGYTSRSGTPANDISTDGPGMFDTIAPKNLAR
jgi:hypothetical protein